MTLDKPKFRAKAQAMIEIAEDDDLAFMFSALCETLVEKGLHGAAFRDLGTYDPETFDEIVGMADTVCV